MNKLLKISLMSVGLVSVLGLTACQSTPQASQAKSERSHATEHHFNGENQRDRRHHAEHHARGEGQRGGEGRHNERHRAPLTEEQRQKFEQTRAERQVQRETLLKSCEGKAGQSISVQISGKTIEGTCQVHFRPNKPERVAPTPNTTAAPTQAVS